MPEQSVARNNQIEDRHMTKKSSKFGGPFLPFPRWALEYLQGDDVGIVVLVTILQYMDSDTQELTTSYQWIGKLIKRDRRTVIRAMNRLVSIGVIYRTPRVGKKGSLSNRYLVNFNNPNVNKEMTSKKTPVSRVTPPLVSLETLPSDTGDTPPSVTGDTQSRITNNKNNSFKKGTEGIDPRLKRKKDNG